MHDTSLLSGKLFADNYANKENLTVLDIGGLDVNGSLRQFFTKNNYISIDIENGPNVDLVVPPGERLPFEDGSVDIVVSTSCFEHDPCFWMTFREMCRVVKVGGFIYASVPAGTTVGHGFYHTHPGDNYRFYPDAGQSLAFWSGKILDGKSYPTKVEEVLLLYPINDIWIDFVCVWKRVDEAEKVTSIVDVDSKNLIGPLKMSLLNHGCKMFNPTDGQFL